LNFCFITLFLTLFISKLFVCFCSFFFFLSFNPCYFPLACLLLTYVPSSLSIFSPFEFSVLLPSFSHSSFLSFLSVFAPFFLSFF
jgi:hypothetical protein